jgi:hypothetical protein
MKVILLCSWMLTTYQLALGQFSSCYNEALQVQVEIKRLITDKLLSYNEIVIYGKACSECGRSPKLIWEEDRQAFATHLATVHGHPLTVEEKRVFGSQSDHKYDALIEQRQSQFYSIQANCKEAEALQLQANYQRSTAATDAQLKREREQLNKSLDMRDFDSQYQRDKAEHAEDELFGKESDGSEADCKALDARIIRLFEKATNEDFVKNAAYDERKIIDDVRGTVDRLKAQTNRNCDKSVIAEVIPQLDEPERLLAAVEHAENCRAYDAYLKNLARLIDLAGKRLEIFEQALAGAEQDLAKINDNVLWQWSTSDYSVTLGKIAAMINAGVNSFFYAKGDPYYVKLSADVVRDGILYFLDDDGVSPEEFATRQMIKVGTNVFDRKAGELNISRPPKMVVDSKTFKADISKAKKAAKIIEEIDKTAKTVSSISPAELEKTKEETKRVVTMYYEAIKDLQSQVEQEKRKLLFFGWLRDGGITDYLQTCGNN